MYRQMNETEIGAKTTGRNNSALSMYRDFKLRFRARASNSPKTFVATKNKRAKKSVFPMEPMTSGSAEIRVKLSKPIQLKVP
jgi:hypothetical protein